MEETKNQDPRVYFAVEQSFLAWIRTGMALMAFGFVVARFGLFLRELRFIQHDLPQKSVGLSTWAGSALVALGAFVNVLAALTHVRQIKALNQNALGLNRPSSLAIAVALTLAAVGTAMVIYFVWMELG